MTPLVRLLCEELGLTSLDLERIIRTAPRRYKAFRIPKRNGGEREIAQPARELKAIQRILVEHFLSGQPIHPSAQAYIKGKSIRDNALAHAGTTPILKMDFRDFFPSIRSEDWRKYCVEQHLFDDPRDIENSSLILFRRTKGERVLKLSIGAPSSPALSNVLLYKFDSLVDDEARGRGIVYTRYADDITFSGQRIGMLRDMIDVVRYAAREAGTAQLTVNNDKTVFATTAVRRRVTGLVLTNDGAISLGRDWKRKISAQMHHAKHGKLNQGQMQKLAGNISYARSIEPDFVERLSRKYGANVVDPISRMVAMRKLQ